mgnify:CR=1 FL=1
MKGKISYHENEILNNFLKTLYLIEVNKLSVVNELNVLFYVKLYYSWNLDKTILLRKAVRKEE